MKRKHLGKCRLWGAGNATIQLTIQVGAEEVISTNMPSMLEQLFSEAGAYMETKTGISDQRYEI